jgi:hypothetical protein
MGISEKIEDIESGSIVCEAQVKVMNADAYVQRRWLGVSDTNIDTVRD